MAEAMEFRVTKDEVTPFIKRFGKLAPKAIGDALHKIALKAQNHLRNELGRQGVQSVNLMTGTRAQRLSNIRSVVNIPLSGIYRDRMAPHYVSLKPGRKITKWTKEHMPLKKTHGGSRVYLGPRGGVKGALYVVPHPWINRPISNAARAGKTIMKQELDKVVK